MVRYTEVESIPAVLIAIDFEKAFDRIEYSSVYAAMKAFGFREKIIQMIAVLFNGVNLATINNTFLSKWFIPTCGLFQGNPIASYLSLVIIEALAIQICNNKSINS